jgi:hypothetical protein
LAYCLQVAHLIFLTHPLIGSSPADCRFDFLLQ